jgi:ribosomal protein L7Ae-like RNA K-turn-binding protein
VRAAVTKRAFARAARAPVVAPEDLPDRVEQLLAKRCVELLGLARRAGRAVGGFEKVREALKAGPVGVLVTASDAGEDGKAKLRGIARDAPLFEGLTAAELGAAFGRDALVHASVAPGKLARALVAEGGRLAGFRGPAGTDKAIPAASGRKGETEAAPSGRRQG